MEYQYLKFLNLEYFFCIIYSLLGGECTDVNAVEGSVASTSLSHVSVATGTPSSSVSANVDFWTWLFGGATHTATDVAAGATTAGPLVGAIAFVGGVVAFLWGAFSAIAYTISGILILLIIGAAVGLFLIRSSEVQAYGTLSVVQETGNRSRSRWQQLLDRAISTDPKEWRGAILEADTMLGELLEKLGYAGTMTAERLRAVPEGAFVTLPNAWEAHRIRNFVAARTSDYILTQREAFRVMKLYEQVFEEFDFV